MLKRGNWSVTELFKLRASYGRRPIGQLASELHRTPRALRQRAQQLFAGRSRGGELTRAEEAELRRMVGVADLATMRLVLGRSEEQIRRLLASWATAGRSGRLAAWEVAYLKACYATRPDWALELVLGRTLPAIHKQARRLCLGRPRRPEAVPIEPLGPVVTLQPQPRLRMPRWTKSDVEALEHAYPHQPNLLLASSLQRSVKSVIAKANELGLRKSQARLRAMGRENVGHRKR
jgi:hypothetical protein